MTQDKTQKTIKETTRKTTRKTITQTNRQPEALATFAEAARTIQKKPKDIGLTATKATAPLNTSSAAKQDAATRVLREGVTGRKQGAKEAIDRLPDRTKPR